MDKIGLHAPNINFRESSKIINKCLKSNWVSTDGNLVNEFEKRISKFTGAKYTIACNSGTSALHVALRLAGVSRTDEVIVPTLTFVAPVNSIIYNNASPIFMDCDDYYNLDIKKTINFLKKETFFKNGFTFNKRTKRCIKAVLPVNVWGNALRLDNLKFICDKKNIKIIEDASEALGTFLKKRKRKIHVGLCGLAGCLSFNANKIITSGCGGAIITNNKKIASKALFLTTQAKENSVEYIHSDVGYNYRLTNISAALGISELGQIKKRLLNKKKLHETYKKKISIIKGLEVAKTPNYASNNHWINLLILDKKYHLSKKSLIKNFFKKDIVVRPVWKPNHLQKPFLKYQRYKISKAVDLYRRSICIPSGSAIKSTQIKKIFDVLISK